MKLSDFFGEHTVESPEELNVLLDRRSDLDSNEKNWGRSNLMMTRPFRPAIASTFFLELQLRNCVS